MKKLLLIASCFAFGLSLNAQLVNGDFESAATPLLPGIATDSPGWGQGLYTVETTGAYAGSKFGKMKTIYDPNTAALLQFPSDTIAGFIQQFVTGPVSNPASLNLNYAYKNITTTGDSAVVIVQVYDTLTADPNDDVIMYFAAGVYTGSNTNWTMESIPLQALNTTGYTANAYVVVASSSIGFLFGTGNGYPGSELWLDNISLSSSSAEVIELSSSLTVYPNPATEVLNIKSDEAVQSVTITSIDGKVVANEKSETIDISALNAGVYVYTVTSVTGKTSQGNFIKK